MSVLSPCDSVLRYSLICSEKEQNMATAREGVLVWCPFNFFNNYIFFLTFLYKLTHFQFVKFIVVIGLRHSYQGNGTAEWKKKKKDMEMMA